MEVRTVKFEAGKPIFRKGVRVTPTPRPHVLLDEQGGVGRVAVADELYEALPMGIGPCPRNGEFIGDNLMDGIPTCPICGAAMTEDRITRVPTDKKVMGVTVMDIEARHDQTQCRYHLTEAFPMLTGGNGMPFLIPASSAVVSDKILLFVEAEGMIIRTSANDPKFAAFNKKAVGGFTKAACVVGVKDSVEVTWKSTEGGEKISLIVAPGMKLKTHRHPTFPNA